MESDVDPTRSTNITVSWRRSAWDGRRIEAVDDGAACRAAIAVSSFLRCPSGRPSFSKSASVSDGSTSASMAMLTEQSRVIGKAEILKPLCDVHPAKLRQPSPRSEV